MTKRDFARTAAVTAIGEDNPRLGDWTDWMELILSLIAGIPCLANKTPEQARAWLVSHPTMARLYVRPLINRKRPSWASSSDVDAAYDALTEATMAAQPSEFATAYYEARR